MFSVQKIPLIHPAVRGINRFINRLEHLYTSQPKTYSNVSSGYRREIEVLPYPVHIEYVIGHESGPNLYMNINTYFCIPSVFKFSVN